MKRKPSANLISRFEKGNSCHHIGINLPSSGIYSPPHHHLCRTLANNAPRVWPHPFYLSSSCLTFGAPSPEFRASDGSEHSQAGWGFPFFQHCWHIPSPEPNGITRLFLFSPSASPPLAIIPSSEKALRQTTAQSS